MNKFENIEDKPTNGEVEDTGRTETASGDEIPIPGKGLLHSRTDKKRLHATRHGVHSRRLYEALASRGENVRELRLIERLLRVQLQPRGILAEIMFDRAWACYLRCLLLTIAEKDLFSAVNKVNFEERLQQANLLALATGNPGAEGNQPLDLLKELSLIQRYDAHFWREFCRALDTLLASRQGGEVTVAQRLNKTLPKNTYNAAESND